MRPSPTCSVRESREPLNEPLHVGNIPQGGSPKLKGNIMIRKIALAVIASTAFGAAFAQTSNVNLHDANQTQFGSYDWQTAYVGTVWGKGTSNVNMHDVNQTQFSYGSSQGLSVGTVWGSGTSNVSMHDANQT